MSLNETMNSFIEKLDSAALGELRGSRACRKAFSLSESHFADEGTRNVSGISSKGDNKALTIR